MGEDDEYPETCDDCDTNPCACEELEAEREEQDRIARADDRYWRSARM